MPTKRLFLYISYKNTRNITYKIQLKMEKKFKSQKNMPKLPLIPNESKRKLQDISFIRNSSKISIERLKDSIKSHSQEPKKLVIDMRNQINQSNISNNIYCKQSSNENIQHRVINHKLLKIKLGINYLKSIPLTENLSDSVFYYQMISKEQQLYEFYREM